MSAFSLGGFSQERVQTIPSLDASPPNLPSTSPTISYPVHMMAKPYIPRQTKLPISRPAASVSTRVLPRPADLSLNWRSKKESYISPSAVPKSPHWSSRPPSNIPSLSTLSVVPISSSVKEGSNFSLSSSPEALPRKTITEGTDELLKITSSPSSPPVRSLLSASLAAQSGSVSRSQSKEFLLDSTTKEDLKKLPPLSRSPPTLSSSPLFSPSLLSSRNLPALKNSTSLDVLQSRDTSSSTALTTLSSFYLFQSDDPPEILGRAGSSTSAAFLVRSKKDSRLFIFKPFDGEGYEEQNTKESEVTNKVSVYSESSSYSPQIAQSFVPSISEPTSPDSCSTISVSSSLLQPTKTPLKRGVQYGEGVVKEVAAFLLDSPDHYSKVPETHAVSLLMPRNTDALPVIDPASISTPHNEGKDQGRSLFGNTSSASERIPPVSAPIAIPQQNKRLSLSSSKPVLFSTGSFDHQRYFSSDKTQDEEEPTNSSDAVSDSALFALNYPSENEGDLSLTDSFCSTSTKNNEDCIWRFGSLTVFQPHLGNADDFGPGVFLVDDVHRIGILDIRLLNLDRHLGNMLVSKDQNEKDNSISNLHLIPIDHAYSLPSYQDLSDVNFGWFYWKQAAQPFSESSLRYIESIDPLADAYKLSRIGIRDESLVSLLFASLLLQKGAAAGLTLREIASLVQRPKHLEDEEAEEEVDTKDNNQSVLENIVKEVFSKWALENSTDSISESSSIPSSSNSLGSQVLTPCVSPSISPFSFSVMSPPFAEVSNNCFTRASTLPQPSSLAESVHEFLSPSDSSVVPFSPSRSSSHPTNVSGEQLHRLLSLIGNVIDKEIDALKQGRGSFYLDNSSSSGNY